MTEISFQEKQRLGDQYLQEALSLFHDRQTQGALDALGKVMQLGIPIKNCHLVRAVCLAATNLSFLALEAAQEEARLFPDDSNAQSYLASLRENMRQAAVTPGRFNTPLPIFSIVVAADERWPGFLRSVRSALMQHYQNIEVVVVLQTREPEALRQFSSLDPRVRIFAREGASIAEALEFGLLNAKGTHQLVIDAPTMIFSDTGLRVIAEVFSRVPDVSFVSAERAYFDSNGFAQPMRFNLQRWNRQILLDGSNFNSPSLTMSFSHTAWSAELFNQAGGSLNTMLQEALDYDLFLRFTRHAQPFTVTVPLMIGEVPLNGYSRALSTKYVAEALATLKREERENPPCVYVQAAPPLIKVEGKKTRLLDASNAVFPVPRPSDEITRLLRERGPRISVVTPSFNQAEYLEETIDSVLSQGYPHIEYIIIDGGSTDGSQEIIKKHARYLHFWRSAPDAGQYFAIQDGFGFSSGEVMTWINSDDLLRAHSLAYAGATFLLCPYIRWLTGRHSALQENGEESQGTPVRSWSREHYLKEGFDRPFIQQEGTFWSRSLWEQAGATLDLRLSLAGDMELWRRFFRYARLHTFEGALGSYRCHPKQRSQIFMAAYYREAEAAIREEFDLIRRGHFTEMLDGPPILAVKEIQPSVYTRGQAFAAALFQ